MSYRDRLQVTCERHQAVVEVNPRDVLMVRCPKCEPDQKVDVKVLQVKDIDPAN